MKKSADPAASGNDNLLRLDPLHIPNMAPAFEDYAGGIGVGLVEDGLKCYVDIWFPNGDGDAIAFYWDDAQTPVWNHTIDDNPPDRLPIQLNRGLVREGDVDPVFYSVTRPSQTPVDSPRQKFLVKLNRPGGYDDQPSIPGHSGLRYEVPQEIIDNGVGPSEADAGVDITIFHYEHMRKNDRIRLAWGRATVEHLVQPDEVDTDITIHVDRATIEAGREGQVTIAYQVVDVCNNYPDERAPWSADTTVVVDLNGNRLDAPQVLVNGIPTQTIDLEQLAGADVICRVYTSPTDYLVGDTLRLTWVGTPAQGDSQVIVGPLDKTVEYVPFPYDFSIPNEDVVAIAKGRASVSYVRIRNGEADRPSNNASVTVVGDIQQPARPDIIEATGSALDPDLNFYTVSIPYYPGRQPGDHLYILFEGLDASNGSTSFDDNAYVGSEADGDPVLRNVNKAEIKKLDGGSLTVYYWINSQRKSLELQLAVGSGQAEMVKPNVIEADSNDVLDPEKVNPNVGANVIVTFTDTVPDDIIGLRWRGSRISAPVDERPLNANSAGAPVPFTVAYRYVLDNLNGTVDVDYYLKRGAEVPRYSRVRSLTIGAAMNLSAPSVKEATGIAPSQQLNPVAGKDKLTVVIPDYGVQPGDQVSVTWAGTAGGGSYTSPMEVLSPDREISMPVSVIGYNLNRTVTITYRIRNNVESDPSSPLTLRVQSIPESELPPLVILQASTDQVDVHGIVTFRVDAWPFYRQGDRVWLTLESDNPNGTTDKLSIWTASPITAAEFNRKYLQRVITDTAAHAAWLRALPGGREVRVVFKVVFGGGSNEADAQVFPVLKIGVVPQPQWPRSKMSYLSWQNMAATETLHVPTWAFAKQGQQVWLTLEGRTGLGGSHNLPIDNGTTITATEARSGLNRAIQKSYFDQLGHDTTLRVVGQISLDGGVTRVNLRPLEVMFTQYFLLAAKRMDGDERGRFVPDVPGTFAFIMPSAEMGPTALRWGGVGFTNLSIPVTNSQGTVRNVVVRGQRSMGDGGHGPFNNAAGVAGGGSTFMHLDFVMQDNSTLPTGSYKGTFRAILKGYNTPSFTQDVWVQVLIEK
ncbi:hypothetical protein GKKCFE_18630 [Pseudomonas sp. E141]|uniref:hypothetical protein n=1 Tax=Pseudomonas sp. E141 TaxID=2875961 RepID=UPI004046353D